MEQWIIELFGVSAIGKSTLLRNFLHQSKESWVVRSQLEKHEGGLPDALHEELFVRKAHWIIAQNADPILVRAEKISRLSRVLATDIAARDILPKASFLDEGMAHHLGGYLQQMSTDQPEALQVFMQGRAFVHMTGDPENVLPRVRKRLADNPWCGTYSAFQDDEIILAYIRRGIDYHAQLSEFFACQGCPVITLRIEGENSEHLGAIASFAKRLSVSLPVPSQPISGK